jgi:hypothetical protein
MTAASNPRPACGRRQGSPEVVVGFRVDRDQQPLLLPGLLPVARVTVLVLDLHAGDASQLLDGVHVLEPAGLHEVAHRVAGLVAAEAVVEPLVRADRKRRLGFRVERAQALEVPAPPAQLDLLPDEVGQIDPLQYLLYDRFCDSARHSLRPSTRLRIHVLRAVRAK